MDSNHKISEIFGMNVFNDFVMRERLPKATYKAIKQTIEDGLPLQPNVAEVVANTMKDWAIEKGATHFSHWFQPMTNVTAEKLEAFISPTPDGKVIMEFSGKELIKGESDASSFPSGGLRVTFEARGYTAWDCTSPAFIKEDAGGKTLCIPTAFYSYTGEALDKKVPLLRSMEALDKQAMRILRLFGNTATKKVIPTTGAEQEYFLVDLEMYKKRKDLMYTGRTLFGAKPPKGQELDDHYYCALKERVASFMSELDVELWKLGVSAKTKHNEAAPAQHELAPIFASANIATDHNQITMETMKRVALRHGLYCLLNEKPFAGINGSGKHNNWSLSTDDGQNLLEPGNTPHDNAQFLTFLCAIIKGIDDYAELLRYSAANAGNDHRLGTNEAPPAIISIFLGDELTQILEKIENNERRSSHVADVMEVGVTTLPKFRKDSTDRNRTSPFAFTGNKFEFRMVPSSASISGPNVALNTIVAQTLCEIADKLEEASDFKATLQDILSDIAKNHKRIIFNGNGYSDEWVVEAQKRGLKNISSTAEAIGYFASKKSIKLYEKHGVFCESEIHARCEVKYENYIKRVNIESLTMLDMAKTDIIPACINFAKELSQAAIAIKSATGKNVSVVDTRLAQTIELLDKFSACADDLEQQVDKFKCFSGKTADKAAFCRDSLLTSMAALREVGDRLEMIIDRKMWPFPTYGDLLYFV